MKPVNVLLVAVLAVASASCGTTNVPVYDYQTKSKSSRGGIGQTSQPGRSTGAHVVREGDTLHSIAWRYGWDYRDLAAANNIASPFTIYPGQQIRFDQKNRRTTAVASRPATTPPATKPAQPKQSTRTTRPTEGEKTASKPTTAPKTASKPTVASQRVAEATPPSNPPITSDVAWRWPVPGKVLQGFSTAKDRRGLLLAGKLGDPVHAAAAGTVVYRGSGLTGYGNLLIVKHNDRWLSAYGHNDTLLVKEGQQVRAGERIATMGATGTSSVALHFEIRRDGQAVNPEQVLPRR